MNLRARFAYAQARCQARFALHPRTPWNIDVGDVDTPDALMPLSRARFHPMLTAVSQDTGLHEVDRLTRAVFRQIVADVAHWVPETWRSAIRWLAIIVDLPAIQHLLDGGEPYAWLHDDDGIARWLQMRTQQNPASRESHEWLSILKQRLAGEALEETWFRCWQGHWPADAHMAHPGLLRLRDSVLRIRQAMLHRSEAGADAGRLEKQLIRVFRQEAQTPAAICAYIGLAWLELVRFRAELIGREFAVRGY